MTRVAAFSIALIGATVSLLAQEPERRVFWAPKLGGEFTPTASDELMEYSCQDNQYGIAGGHPNPFAQ